MNNYKLINNVVGWVVFLIAAFVYVSTIEPTGSFWDCGEFIATAYKLQVGHPPGAPFFMLIGRFFSLFAQDVTQVAVTINILSALASAFTILFLFWTITALAKKIILKEDDSLNTSNIVGIMGAGFVGALAGTFCDSFWFSAVEGEVYATSSFFTALVVWAMFKWEGVANEKHHLRWIIFIAFMMGLSIGVHLLNLLTIPALAFIYYFKKYPVTQKGIIWTSVIALLILGIVQFGVIAGLVNIASKFELLFVNSFGLPFWSGFFFFILLLIGGIVYGLKYSTENGKPIMNTAILCFTFILIGYTTYGTIVIRSIANPPMDENNPEHPFSLLSYLNREQYGDRPLLFGQHFNAQVKEQKKGNWQYAKGEKKYIRTTQKIIPVYDKSKSTFLPRMYSGQANHIREYKKWSGVEGDATPTFGQNLKFMFSYQLGWMYGRYFMWNFVGRQNDIQGHGEATHGNWVSGIKALDAVRLGPRDDLPDSMTNNKGQNHFYFLPLLLGLIGLIFHIQKDRNDFWVVALLFFFTGIAIVLYLNFPPIQPRERDYAFAGSFYAFSMWIGLGVLGIRELLKKFTPGVVAGALAAILCFAGVPYLMAKDGWDDHNRAKRYTSRDFAHNYLESCAPNAIIFTNGDNDTFPLWYAQEVEGIRTDVRVVNLSLLNTDWYIEQMKRKAYDSDAVPFSFTEEQYRQGTRDYVPYYDRKLSGYTPVKDVVEFIKSDNEQTKARTQGGSNLDYYPTKKISIPINKELVIASGAVAPEDLDKIVDEIRFDIPKGYLMKADLMILDLLAYNDWKRPIYFAVTVGSDSYLNLDDYFQLEGLAYRFVPIKATTKIQGGFGRVNTSIMYNNMMNKFLWGNIDDPDVYLDQNNINMSMNLRNNFGRLADALLQEGKRDSAVAVLDHCIEVFPHNSVPYNLVMLRMAESYYKAAKNKPGATTEIGIAPSIEQNSQDSKQILDKGDAIVKQLAEIYEDDLDYYFTLIGTEYLPGVKRDLEQGMAIMRELARMAGAAGNKELQTEITATFEAFNARYQPQQ